MALDALKRLMIRGLGWATGFPEGAASNLKAIDEHLGWILGTSAQHWHELYSPDIHVDVLHYAPGADRDFHYLVTSGVSDQPMSNGRRIELALALPAHWDVSQAGFQDPAAFAPVKLLKLLARYPTTYETYFEKRHTVSLANSPEYSPMAAALLMPPVLVQELAEPLILSSGEEIEFLGIYLLHAAELDLKLNGLLADLFEKFGDHSVTELYDLLRPSVV